MSMTNTECIRQKKKECTSEYFCALRDLIATSACMLEIQYAYFSSECQFQ